MVETQHIRLPPICHAPPDRREMPDFGHQNAASVARFRVGYGHVVDGLVAPEVKYVPVVPAVRVSQWDELFVPPN